MKVGGARNGEASDEGDKLRTAISFSMRHRSFGESHCQSRKSAML
jgi:hypothetical protein